MQKKESPKLKETEIVRVRNNETPKDKKKGKKLRKRLNA